MQANNTTHHTACCSAEFEEIDYAVICKNCHLLAEVIPKTLGIDVGEDIKLTEHLAG